MLPKEYVDGQLYLGNELEGFRLFGNFQEVKLDDENKESEKPCVLDRSHVTEITVDWDLPRKMTVGDVILVFHGFDAEKLMQNNWRKMHGMIMHKRKNRR